MSVAFFFKLPIEDICSLASQSLPIELTAVVPESTEDILLKGFASLEMKEERIETAQQVNGPSFLGTLDYSRCLSKNVCHSASIGILEL